MAWLRARDLRLPDDVDRDADGTRPDLIYRLPDGNAAIFVQQPARKSDEPDGRDERAHEMSSAISAGASSLSGPAPNGRPWRPAIRAYSAPSDEGDAVTTTELPAFEVGALVQARGREWVVLPQSRAARFPGAAPARRRGRRGRRRFPRAGAGQPGHVPAAGPRDAGTAASAGLLRTALRIGFRASAGPFRSLARLAVEPRAYQLVPLLMALRQDTVRLLIADDVGIGKTIEAGLVATELLEQGDATGLAVLCGPALAEQWQQELATKFGIHAELVLPGTIRRLERGLLQGETLFDRFRHIVVSTDFIKRPGLREQFWHGCPDLLIIDEAHTCVSDGTGGRSRMLRHELVSGLAKDAARHLILVTATPHSGKEEGSATCWRCWSPDLAYVDLESVAGPGTARPLLRAAPPRATSAPISTRRPPFPEDRLSQERPYLLSPAYKELFADVLAVRPRNRPGSRRRPAAAAGQVLVGAGAAARAGVFAAGGGRHVADQGRQRRHRRCRRKPTGLAARPCSTSPTRRPSSPLTPPRARTARPTQGDTAHRRRLQALRCPGREAGRGG